MKKLVVLLAVVGALFLVGCKKETDTAGKPVVVKVGLVGEKNDQWKYIAKKLEEDNIKLELVTFSEYSLPNQALADKDIDMNAFQHYAYLNNEIASRKFDLTVIGDSVIAPLGLYSKKIKDVSEFKQGDKIAIPSDPTNGGRALKVLESAGLLKVKPEAGYLPNIGDVTENKLNLQIIEIEAAMTPRLLDDVTASIINGAHAVDAGFTPSKDAIYLEGVQEGGENPYINVIVVRTAEKDNPVYKRVVEVYHTDEVEKIIEVDFRGAYVPAWK